MGLAIGLLECLYNMTPGFFRARAIRERERESKMEAAVFSVT